MDGRKQDGHDPRLMSKIGRLAGIGESPLHGICPILAHRWIDLKISKKNCKIIGGSPTSLPIRLNECSHRLVGGVFVQKRGGVQSAH